MCKVDIIAEVLVKHKEDYNSNTGWITPRMLAQLICEELDKEDKK